MLSNLGTRQSRSLADLTNSDAKVQLSPYEPRNRSVSSGNLLTTDDANFSNDRRAISNSASALHRALGPNLQQLMSKISQAEINKRRNNMAEQMRGRYNENSFSPSPVQRSGLRSPSVPQSDAGGDYGLYIGTSSSRDSTTPPPRLYGPPSGHTSGRISPNPEMDVYATPHNHQRSHPGHSSSGTNRSHRHLNNQRRSPHPSSGSSLNIPPPPPPPPPPPLTKYGSVPILDNLHDMADRPDPFRRRLSLPKNSYGHAYTLPPEPIYDNNITRGSDHRLQGEPQDRGFSEESTSFHRNISPRNSSMSMRTDDTPSDYPLRSHTTSGYTTPTRDKGQILTSRSPSPANKTHGNDVRDRLNNIFSRQMASSFTPVQNIAHTGSPDRPASTQPTGHHSRTPSQQMLQADLHPPFEHPGHGPIHKKESSDDNTIPSSISANIGVQSANGLHNGSHDNAALQNITVDVPSITVIGEEKIRNNVEENPTDAFSPEPDYPDSESGISFDGSSGYKSKHKDEDITSTAQTNDFNINEDGQGEVEEEADLTWRPYDVFTVAERENEDDNKVFKEILKVMRLSLYGIIVLIILVGTVCSRISLFLLASDISQTKESRGKSVVLIMICMCAPMVYNWLGSLLKILFGGKEWPSIKTFAVMLFFELVSTYGLCLLVFKIIPSIDFFRGMTVTFAMFQIPSILKVMMLNKQPECGFKITVRMGAAILAMLAQIGALVYFMIMEFSVEKHDKTLSGYDYTKETEVEETLLFEFVWELPVALVLVSLGWWENFVSCDWSLFGRVRMSFKHWRHVLQETRETSNFLLTPLKIALIVLLGKYLADADFALPEWTWQTRLTEAAFHARSYSLLYIQLGSTVVCTYLAGLACKLHMQKTAFAFPLVLSPPVSLVVVYLQCRYEFLPVTWHTGSWYCPNIQIENLIQPIAVSGALWLSYCIIVSHIWFPKSERMAKIEKLFLTPHFHALFPDFHLTLRRRRNDHELRTTRFDHFSYAGDHQGDHVTHEPFQEESYVTPTIYVCATMWHETRQEMTQLLKSLFRLDYGHCASKLAQAKFHVRDPDYFDMEIHIIFDDAFELDIANNKFVPNSFVRQFIDCMEDAARSVVKGFIIIPSPVKVTTPYGGRLIWTMPGQTRMVVHLKDKNKIRHRKRWSQVMYLYYLLGFRLLGAGDGTDVQEEEEQRHHHSNNLRNRKKKGGHRRKRKHMPMKQLLMRVPPEEYEQIIETSENTFILTLDGDVDFKPDSVKLLVDRMKKNKKVGAVCGRIHPIGAGPMVWYQQFEYAVGHWLQKAAEHVFGCVLCCPGCFSLFRGSAIMDDNVMKMYTTKPTEARHFIQFEQGEDRWLCTLLLQQGHRIDYSAGADALTFAPETFNEFFNQRRRWSPSTLANMMDLLASWRDTVRLNDNISRLYILYQFILMASSILAPSTVILMITSSYHTVLGLSNWWSYVLSVIPVAIYIVVCLTQKTNTQVKVGAVLTAIYTVVMMIATVGTIISIATEHFSSPNVVFLSGLGIIFITAAVLHPQEIYCLVFGAIYFLVVPSTFILLTVFYLCNLNNVSWGTREVPKKLTPAEEEALKLAEEEKKRKKKSWNIFTTIGLMNIVSELRDVIRNIWGLRHDLQHVQNPNDPNVKQPIYETPVDERQEQARQKRQVEQEVTGYEPHPDNPFWLHLEALGNGPVEVLGDAEIEFWRFLIKKYLHPIEEVKEEKEKIERDLLEVRNNVVFIYIMLNFLWTVISLQLQASEDILKDYYIIQKYEPMSLVFLSIFALVMVVQFFGMIIHRWGTFLHLMSSTRIDWFSEAHSDEDFARFVVQEIHKHQNLEPVPDYGESDDDDDTSFPSDLDTAEDNDAYSIPGSVHTSYTNQMVWPQNWNHRPSHAGHFPRYENILNHKLGRLQQQLSRVGSSRRGNTNLARQFSRRDPRFFSGWNNRDAHMRQKFLQQNFQFPQHNPQDRLSRVTVMP